MSGFLPLHDIARICHRTPGGLRDIGIIDPDDVDFMPDQQATANIEAITLKPGKRIFLFQQDRFSGQFDYRTATDTRPGDTVNCELKATVRGVALDRDFWIQKILNRRVHVLLTYQDGKQRLMRNARFTATHGSGARLTDRAGYTFSATSRLAKVPPLIDETLTLPFICTGADTGPCDCIDTEMISITTTQSTYTYNVPQGRLLTAIRVRSTAAQVVKVGSAAEADDIIPATPTDANQAILGGNNALYAEVVTPLHFSGLAGTNTIHIWLLKDS